MAADFKSHVLRRDEKGLFGIPFKRWLLGGVGGGLTHTVFNLALAHWSIPLALLMAVAILILTGPRGGIPLWNRLVYRARGFLLLSAEATPDGVSARLADALNLPVNLVRLDGAQVFAPPDGEIEIDLREWITFATATDDDGLIFVDTPLETSDG